MHAVAVTFEALGNRWMGKGGIAMSGGSDTIQAIRSSYGTCVERGV